MKRVVCLLLVLFLLAAPVSFAQWWWQCPPSWAFESGYLIFSYCKYEQYCEGVCPPLRDVYIFLGPEWIYRVTCECCICA